jgi:hypothetical protein
VMIGEVPLVSLPLTRTSETARRGGQACSSQVWAKETLLRSQEGAESSSVGRVSGCVARTYVHGRGAPAGHAGDDHRRVPRRAHASPR